MGALIFKLFHNNREKRNDNDDITVVDQVTLNIRRMNSVFGLIKKISLEIFWFWKHFILNYRKSIVKSSEIIG